MLTQFNIKKQRQFFESGVTMSADFRIKQLKRLKHAIKANDYLIYEALQKDLNKKIIESYMTELSMIYQEIDYMMKHIRRWMRPKRVPTSLLHFYSKSNIHQQPYGTVLIISPWNYPVQLSFVPLIGAIAAGNCAVVKPSEIAPHSSQIIRQIIEQVFPPEYVAVEEGDGDVSQAILAQGVDYCFFTGSTKVGKAIMEAASQHLTPVSLELGGKSPTIVARDTNIRHAAQRIVWGKFINSGQTCVAPDYILVDELIQERFVQELIRAIEKFYGAAAENNPDYPSIINQKHFQRLTNILGENDVHYGGQLNQAARKISPAIILQPDLDGEVMEEEIFGPILPIVSYSNVQDALAYVRSKPKPLALYLFTQNDQLKEYVAKCVSFGGGAINDTIIHLANHHLPFGGIGASGMGNYHARHSLETFSHSKSILEKTDCFDIKLRYPPYSDWMFKLIKKIW